MLSHLLDEILGSWPLHDKDFLGSPIDVHWDNVVWLGDLSELTVDECFIEVENERFPAFHMLRLGT